MQSLIKAYVCAVIAMRELFGSEYDYSMQVIMAKSDLLDCQHRLLREIESELRDAY